LRSIIPTFGDPTDERVLEDVGAARAEAIVAILNDPGANLHVCQVARGRFGIPVVVSRADDHAMMEKMMGLGVRVIQPALATAIALEAALRFPAAFDVLAEHGHDVEIGEATIRNVWFDRRPLRDIRLPGNALVMGIRRWGEVIVPHRDTTFRLGDVVMLVGSPDAIKQTDVFVGMGYAEHVPGTP
jgi:Trk K+ transport system NAD-binding subunit